MVKKNLPFIPLTKEQCHQQVLLHSKSLSMVE